MPLPAALLERLTKRGLVNKSKASSQQKKKTPNQNEEIIAEDYDELEEPYPYDYEPVKKPQESFWSERLKQRIVDGSITGYKGCPNKYNIFHKCTLYCISAYGDGILEPKRWYLQRKNRLLNRYPLPKGWKEVYDFGCGVHYYWKVSDDTVSWLPPGHPKACISKSAAALRKELEALLPEIEEMEDNNTISIEGMNIELPSSQENSFEQDQSKSIQIKKTKTRDLEKTIRSRTERKQRVDAFKESGVLDPMDPAAYSNVERGKWSAGLETDNEIVEGDASTPKKKKIKTANHSDKSD